MNKSVSVRVATLADLKAIVAVEEASFEGDKFAKNQFAYLISQAKGIFYVAESDGCILGYISLLKRARSSILRIYSIAVVPEARGQRIGQMLIDRGAEYGKINKQQYISLEVRVDNKTAIKLYQKNGFEIAAVIQEYYEDGTSAFRMKARL